jgi:hypothetical protein
MLKALAQFDDLRDSQPPTLARTILALWKES